MCAETTWFGNCHSYSNAVVFDGSGHSLAADDDNRKKRLPHQIIGSNRHGMLLKPDIKKLLQL